MKDFEKGGNVEVQECRLPERDCLLSEKIWKEAEGIQKWGSLRLCLDSLKCHKAEKLIQ